MSTGLRNKSVVITGAGRGIGKAMAKLFAAEGAGVLVNDIDAEPARQTVQEIEKAGGRAVLCVADVANPSEAQKIIEKAVDAYNQLDILICNAGIVIDRRIHQMTDEQWDLVIDVNLRGAFNCTRAAAPYMMKENHNGRVIYISSLPAETGNYGQANYASAKAALFGLMKTVAREWRRFGITVNCILYGLVDTRIMQEKETSKEVFRGEKIGTPRKIRNQFIQESGGQLMSPEEAARPALLLASEEAASITGNIINASGGWYI